MNKLIKPLAIAALSIATFATTASAASLPDKYYREQMPAQYRGSWCETSASNTNTSRPTWVMRKCTGGDLVVDAKGFSAVDDVCQPLKIMLPKLDPNHISVKFVCTNYESLGKKGDVLSVNSEGQWMLIWDMRRVGNRMIVTQEYDGSSK
jgi:hypothetical protein